MGPYVHGNCTAVFPLTATIFLQMKSASFNKSDKLPVPNCWPVNFFLTECVTWLSLLHEDVVKMEPDCCPRWQLRHLMMFNKRSFSGLFHSVPRLTLHTEEQWFTLTDMITASYTDNYNRPMTNTLRHYLLVTSHETRQCFILLFHRNQPI